MALACSLGLRGGYNRKLHNKPGQNREIYSDSLRAGQADVALHDLSVRTLPRVSLRYKDTRVQEGIGII